MTLELSQEGSETKSKGHILVVDDNPVKAFGLSERLKKEGYRVRKAADGQSALELIQAEQPDLILLDIDMPDMNGYQVCQYLKGHETTQRIPIVFISALEQTIDKVKAFEVGGSDYVSMPFQFEELLMRVESQLNIRRMQDQLLNMNAALEERVRQRTIDLEREILERQQAQERLLHMAMHDSLTSLPNRFRVIEQIGKNLTRAEVDPNFTFAVLFIDCDQFKVVNDSLGHLVGDQLLIDIAQRLKLALGSEGLLGRLGGDEFLIVVEDVDTVEQVTYYAELVQQALACPFTTRGHEIFLSASTGIVMGSGYQQAETLLRDADTAMYQAKALGRGLYQVFEAKMHDRAMTRLQMESDLRRALEREEFQLNYQPIVCLTTGKLVGLEALLRWRHPQRGLISPGTFITVAEETGLIVQIGNWVLRQACHQIRHWHLCYPTRVPLFISVNLSVRQFSQPNLVGQIDQILRDSGLPSQFLKLEITESAVMENPDKANDVLVQLRARHIQISIDDFGTGYSSLSYLHRFPVNTLKIDRSFIHGMETKEENSGIIGAIVALADNLGMDVIAEGIETREQLDLLSMLGCQFGQGYYFSKPLAPESTELLISSRVFAKAV